MNTQIVASSHLLNTSLSAQFCLLKLRATDLYLADSCLVSQVFKIDSPALDVVCGMGLEE